MLDLLWQWTYFDIWLTIKLHGLTTYSDAWFDTGIKFKKWLTFNWHWTYGTLTLDLLWYWTSRNGRLVLWLWRKLTCSWSVNLSRHPPIANSGHQNLRETESKLLIFNAWIKGQDIQMLCLKCQIFIIFWICTFKSKIKKFFKDILNKGDFFPKVGLLTVKSKLTPLDVSLNPLQGYSRFILYTDVENLSTKCNQSTSKSCKHSVVH